MSAGRIPTMEVIRNKQTVRINVVDYNPDSDVMPDGEQSTNEIYHVKKGPGGNHYVYDAEDKIVSDGFKKEVDAVSRKDEMLKELSEDDDNE